MNPPSWCSAQAWDGTGQCVCVRLDLGWTPFSWVANALNVSCVTSSDIDSFSHQEAGGWGWCLLDPPALPSTAMTTVSTHVTMR